MNENAPENKETVDNSVEFEKWYKEYQRRIESNFTYGYVATAYRKCRDLWEEGKQWTRKYIYDPLAHLYQRIRYATAKFFKDANVNWEISPEVGSCFYCVEFYDKEDNLAFSKIGTSKSVKNRIEQEVNKEYKKYNVEKAIVRRIVYCNNEKTSIGLESFFRSQFILENDGETYIPLDRFSQFFDYSFIDSYISKYQARGVVA